MKAWRSGGEGVQAAKAISRRLYGERRRKRKQQSKLKERRNQRIENIEGIIDIIENKIGIITSAYIYGEK